MFIIEKFIFPAKKRNGITQLCSVNLSKSKELDVTPAKALKDLLKEVAALTSTTQPSYTGRLLTQG